MNACEADKIRKAAIEYATKEIEFRGEVWKVVDKNNYRTCFNACVRDFEIGVGWQIRQSPWIGTRSGKFPDSKDDCILILAGGDVKRGYYYSPKGWLEYPDYKNVLDDVCYWMYCDLLED